MTTRMLHTIARGNSTADPKKFLSTSELRTKDEEGLTPLHIAAQHNQADLIKLFVRKDAKCVNIQDPSGWTALHMAGNNLALRALEVLLSVKDIQVTLPNSDGAPPFLFLLKAAPRELDQLAAYQHVLSLFLSKGASVDSRNRSGETALHYSILKNNLHGLRFLVQHGADVNAVNKLGETPLHYAVRQKQKEAVSILLDANADRYAQSNEHTSPMDIANQPQYEEIRELLADHRHDAPLRSRDAASLDSYLWYRGHRKWKQYFFSANGPVLTYSKNMAGDSGRRVIDLTGMTLRPVPSSSSSSAAATAAAAGSSSSQLHIPLPSSSSSSSTSGDKEHSWEIVTRSGQSHVLAAKTAELRANWMSYLRGVAQQTASASASSNSSDPALLASQSSATLSNSLGSSLGSSSGAGPSRSRDLVAFLSSEENAMCADCSARQPQWLSVKYGSLVCAACAQAHVAVGSLVRNVYFAPLADSTSLGNQLNSQVFERNADCLDHKPADAAATFTHRLAFVHDKYQLRTWGSDISIAAPKTFHRLRDASLSRQRHVKTQFRSYYASLRYHLFARLFFYSPVQTDLLASAPDYAAVAAAVATALAAQPPVLSSLPAHFASLSSSSVLVALCNEVLAATASIGRIAAAPEPSPQPFPDSLLAAYRAAQQPLPSHVVLAAFQWWLPQLVEFYLLLTGAPSNRQKVRPFVHSFADTIRDHCPVVVYLLLVAACPPSSSSASAQPLALRDVVSLGATVSDELDRLVADTADTTTNNNNDDENDDTNNNDDDDERIAPNCAARLSQCSPAVPAPRLPGLCFHYFDEYSSGLAELLPASLDADMQSHFLGFQLSKRAAPLPCEQFLFSFPPRNLSPDESYLVLGLPCQPFSLDRAAPLMHAAAVALQFAPGIQKRSQAFSEHVMRAVVFTLRRAVDAVAAYFACPHLFDAWSNFCTIVDACLDSLDRSASVDDCRQTISTLLHQIRWLVPRMVAVAERYQRL